MNFIKKIFGKRKWETVFSGDVKSRSNDGKLMLQVERERNLYRCVAYGGGISLQIPLSKLIDTFPEVEPILKKEHIKY
jgi:hypothetical protein